MKWTLLRDFDSDPGKLERYSFVRRDEPSTDNVRWVWFERVLDSTESQLRFVIRIEFELAISDQPRASYRENRSYSFNRVVLDVTRRMEYCDSQTCQANTERVEVIGEFNLGLRTLREVTQLANLLQRRGELGRLA